MVHPRRKLTLALVLALALAVVSMGQPALAKPVEPTPTVDPCNARLAIQVATSGAFNLGALPDPSTCAATPDSWDLTFAWPGSPGTSFTTVRIDGADEEYGDGTVVQSPTDVDATTNASAFQHGDVRVTQTLSIVTNPQTGQADAARIAYTVRNDGTASHSVGVRAMLDTEINYNDGAPFRVPGIGAVETEADLSGAAVPASFQVFQDVNDPDHVAAGTLSGSGAVTPDRFVIAAWPGIVNTLWDYTTDPQRSITGDSAYATYWNPQPLGAGQERTYVTYFGLGDISVGPGGPLQAAVSGPATLGCTAGAYQPNPFDIVATIQANAPVFAATAQLNLPPQLSLASGTALVQLGNLAAGDEVQVTWSVTAQVQPTTAVVEYSVVTAGGDQAPTSVTRTIELPGCATGANTPPVAQDQTVSTPQDTPLDLTLAATDADDDPLTYAVTSPPTNGTLSGTAPDLTYTPDAGFTGSDGFTFVANDGTADSNEATVSITVTPPGTQFSMTIDSSQGGVLLIDPEGPADLGTSAKIKIPPQFGPPTEVTVTATLFGVPGEVDETCGGNVCIGQGIEWSVSDPDAIKRMRVKFIEAPFLTHGGRAEDATAYKDGVPVPNCQPGLRDRDQVKPCIIWRWTSRGGLWQITFLVDGSDPKGRI
ncbi:MAG TPA: Ig-like domain-containing protein [Actinomycetota bacterium]